MQPTKHTIIDHISLLIVAPFSFRFLFTRSMSAAMCESALSVCSLLLYYVISEVKAAESIWAELRICAALGDGLMSERTAQDWFKRLREGNISLEDRLRPTETWWWEPAAESGSRSTQDLARTRNTQRGVSFCIIEHLHAIGQVSRLDQWLSHRFGDFDRQGRTEAVASLLYNHRRNARLDFIVTGMKSGASTSTRSAGGRGPIKAPRHQLIQSLCCIHER